MNQQINAKSPTSLGQMKFIRMVEPEDKLLVLELQKFVDDKLNRLGINIVKRAPM